MSLVVGAELYSSDDTFLGALTSDSWSIDSICNPSGPYGSTSSSTSIRNPYGTYGSPFGSESAFSIYATLPPEVRRNGEVLGRLTVSPFILDAINPNALLKELECY